MTYEQAFNKLAWDGYSVYSTPLLANGGLTNRGLTVSCSGQHMGNSVASKAFIRGELEILIKNSHGCSMDVHHTGYQEGVLCTIVTVISVQVLSQSHLRNAREYRNN